MISLLKMGSALGFESREQREFTRRKSKVIMEYILSVHHTGNRVLHVGCGGSTNAAIPAAYENAGFVNYGIDAVRSYVREFHAHGRAHLANALALPFADETFDIVNFTDILEHLFDPLGGLHEAARVLKRKGYLLLDTPNRGCLNPANPLSWLRYRLGLAWPSLLKPRTITGEWAGEVLFHTEFTRREIELLLSQAGLSVEKISPETVSGKEPAALKSILRKALSGGQDYRPWFALARKVQETRRSLQTGTSRRAESSG
jgi:SAM-dependent methyltransferase